MLLAEMYLLAKKYGRKDAATTYWSQCSNTLGYEPFTDENLAGVAALCGPDSSRYVDTPLPNTAFESVCSNIQYTDDREREALKNKLKEGSIFNATFLRRFAVEMLDSFLMVYDGKSPPS